MKTYIKAPENLKKEYYEYSDSEDGSYYEINDLEEEKIIYRDKLKEQKEEEYHMMKNMIEARSKMYQKETVKKKEPTMSRELRTYMELIEDSLFDETFQLLEKQASKIEDDIEQKRYIRNVFNYLFDEDTFVGLLEENKWGNLGKAISTALERPFFEDIKNRLGTVLNVDEASKVSSVLILENDFKSAETFLPYANKDLSIYNSTLTEIIESNNIAALKYVCKNFENIHFNSDELLAMCSNMKTEAIEMLIEDFDFEITTQNRLEKNLAVNMAIDRNIKNFEWLNKHYGDKINYGQEILFSLIEKNDPVGFYGVMLGNKNLKQPQLEKVGNFLFNPKSVDKLSQTDLYEKFFHHKNFDDQMFTLGQGYFVYGLLSKMGLSAKKEGNDSSRKYVRILDTYLNSVVSDSIPDSPEFHVVGAAVHVAKIGDCQSVTDACVLVMRRFGQYINRPNPSGLLPINQVEKESPLFRILINNGAIPPEPEPTFWGNVFNIFKGKKEEKVYQPIRQEKVSKQSDSFNNKESNSITSIRIKMRSDFRTMQEYISDNSCDPVIKMKCENMFLKADKLSMVMEKNNLTSFVDELHFLSENFSNYLKQSLKAYSNIVENSSKLENDEVTSNKVEKAKKICMEHVDLLTEQLNLITSNISNGLNDGALTQLKARGKFLEERFNQSLDDFQTEDNSETKDDGIVQIRPKKKNI